ncbi:MAG TPA: HD domain-containing protein [Rubricoccaceae bacterium]|nr:HD domain-containing protein [Rubricoccaceae bacterium]
MPSRFKLFNDPVHGFVSVPKGLILALIETPAFQRLRRIRQLGLGFLVFPGAVHTRFEHALGAMALMQAALDTLREKGTIMATDEVEAALAAALLHDVGHGPFSHTLEGQLLPPAPDGTPHHHERMSRAIIQRLDPALGGRLGLTLDIFDGRYPRPFFHTLVASQLDMDRLDYLRRDSFYTGVAEGVIGVERILKTMRVVPETGGPDARVVIEAKGAYAVENFILARRLMFWQVYLHKTVVAADHLLRAAFARARARWAEGGAARDPGLAATSPTLAFFLAGEATAADVEDEAVLDAFVRLDDTDVLYSLKRWAGSADPLLADLARRFLDRDLFRTHYLPAPPSADDLAALRERVAAWLVARGLSAPPAAHDDAAYYVAADVSRLDAYRVKGDTICILERDGRLRELSEAEDVAAVGALAGVVEKPYVCVPKEVGGIADRGLRIAD